MGGTSDARAARGAGRGARRARPPPDGQGVPLDLRVRRRRPRDGAAVVSVVAGVEVSPDHFIGGERVASTETFVDLSPIDEQPLAEVARGGPAEAALAVGAAEAAFPGWAALG